MNNFRLWFILFLLVPGPAMTIYGQEQGDNLKALFQDAEYFLMTEDYPEALSAYLRMNRSDNENANIAYRIGMCYLNIPGQKTKAVPYLEMASKHISAKYNESTFGEKAAPLQTLFLLGTAYQIANKLEQAKGVFRQYESFLNVKDVYESDYVDRQIAACDYAAMQMKEPVPVEVTDMGKIIPRDRPDFGAVMSADGNTILYMTEEKFYKAIWMVKKTNNRWSNPVNLTPQVGSDGDAYPTSISRDGTTMYLVRLSGFDADIYISHFEHETWSKMKKLDKPVNSKYYETHACIAPDEKTLYFTSNRKNGLGGIDIYYSTLDKKGRWSEPVNLGPVINTPYNEETPFICDDGVTLYFSSQGHEGMGGFDIFKSQKQPDGNWSEPVNIGYPLNTTDDNLFFYPLENGAKALYTGSLGVGNKYGIVNEIEIRPSPLAKNVLINGSLTTGDNLKDFGQGFTIRIVDKKTNDTISILKPDPETGVFSDSLTNGNYEIIASAVGYEKQVKTLNIQSDYQRSDMNLNINMIPEKVSTGEYVVIKDILFDFNSSTLTDKAILDIERLYQVMMRYPDLYLEVAGHTDSRGEAGYNYELSKKRAHAVINYLNGKGIDPVRFVSRGMGETSNIAMNVNPDGTDNPEGRRLNRSVEIRIIQPENYRVKIEPIPVPDYLKPDNNVEYTIELSRSAQTLDNRIFDPLHIISGEPVKEEFADSVYTYTFGRFYSYIQAEELLKSYVEASFPSARVIKTNELPLPAQEPAIIGGTENQHFAIQIVALRKPADMRNFRTMRDVKMIKGDDGFYRIVYGNYDSKSEAMKDLDETKKRGFDDAFVIDLSQLHQRNATLAREGNTQGQKIFYTIQLKALRTPVGKSYFLHLSGIRVIHGNDGIFRYIYHEFSDLDEAGKELERIKNMGYSDAFVRKTSQIPGY